jgi:hypothetical protein
MLMKVLSWASSRTSTWFTFGEWFFAAIGGVPTELGAIPFSELAGCAYNADAVASVIMRCHHLTHLSLAGEQGDLCHFMQVIHSMHPEYWNDLLPGHYHLGDSQDHPIPAIAKVPHLELFVHKSDLHLPKPPGWPLRFHNITSLKLWAEYPSDVRVIEHLPCLRRLDMACNNADLLDSFWVGGTSAMQNAADH